MLLERKRNLLTLVVGIITLVGLILLIVGIVLLAKAKREGCDAAVAGQSGGAKSDRCSYSEEAERAGVDTFLQKVQDTYFDLHPQDLVYKPGGVEPSVLRAKFKPYNPDPKNLKRITDSARNLLDELDGLGVNTRRLKPRERKAIAQLKHFLQNNFGLPYDADYYAGDFLMGPNLFCWQQICYVGSSDVEQGLGNFFPKNLDDVRLFLNKMKLVAKTFSTYINNLRLGVKAGMVRSTEECLAGINSFKRSYLQISLQGEQGIYDEKYMKPIFSGKFLAGLKSNDLKKWKDENRKTVNESIREYAVKYIGKPIHDVIRYLQTENLEHCVPSSVSSGLAKLPLSHVFVNGKKTAETTSKQLPDGEPLNGKKAYESIMPYFTTISIKPDQVHQLGKEMLKKLYPEVNLIHCDKKSQGWGDTHIKMTGVMSMLDPQTVNMFHFSGPKYTTPNCPVDMAPNFNPSSGAQSYRRSTKDCSRNSYYNIPFFLERPGPKYEEWSVNAHEARPGHHTQVQGLLEHFRDSCGGVISWLDSSTSYTAFSEGWALYAENPLVARDTNVYETEPFQKYGMLKWQVWRALRLIVDTGLHHKGFSRTDALGYFADYAWDTSDTALKEVTRYQSGPGQATAYMIGQLKIIELREYATKELGDDFDLKDFHFYLLAQGSAPLSYLEESVHEYVRCTKDKEQEGCEDVLNPVAPEEERVSEFVGVIGEESYQPVEKPPREDYI
ncbi:uncharacterized protein LOC110068847 [Orbicella faveolata]|uniref:uncharacterized protein LOC110068847 n=1 Tax=Orbicella faveolata TaxID=48498 RepID=UPI0009E4B3C7|nr:uncharacterized protein LOC110068847 [Orbicella faveolata]